MGGDRALICQCFYRGFGFGGGLGMPVVSYAPLPMLVILDVSLTVIVMNVFVSCV